MSTERLKTLLAYKRQLEDTAAQLLNRAAAARGRAESEQAALADAVETARAAFMTHRAGSGSGTEAAVEVVASQRFAARLAGAVEDAIARRAGHEQTVLVPARQAEDEARRGHLTARQDREAIETHWERQRDAQRRQADQKQETEQDDRSGRQGDPSRKADR